jgi:hypothetical protein
MAGHWVKLLQNLIRHTEATRNRFPVLGSFTPRTVETVASDCLRLPQTACGYLWILPGHEMGGRPFHLSDTC